MIFVVRDDASTSDLHFQTSDPTWVAYNKFGGANFYGGNGPGSRRRCYKVSYNRPYDNRIAGYDQGRRKDFLGF